jgi:hypothetical protein
VSELALNFSSLPEANEQMVFNFVYLDPKDPTKGNESVHAHEACQIRSLSEATAGQQAVS